MASREEDGFAPLPDAGEVRVPEPPGGDKPVVSDERAEARSLFEDIETLIDDGRTYLEAEANYQKTRSAFIADRFRAAALFGALAGALGFIALIGLTVGLIIALAPLLTVWGSSAVVVGLEALLALYFGSKAMHRWDRIMHVLGTDDKR